MVRARLKQNMTQKLQAFMNFLNSEYFIIPILGKRCSHIKWGIANWLIFSSDDYPIIVHTTNDDVDYILSVVELAGGGSATNGATHLVFLSNLLYQIDIIHETRRGSPIDNRTSTN